MQSYQVPYIPLPILNKIPYQDLNTSVPARIYLYFLIQLSPFLASITKTSRVTHLLFNTFIDPESQVLIKKKRNLFFGGYTKFSMQAQEHLFSAIISAREFNREANVYTLLGYSYAEWKRRQDEIRTIVKANLLVSDEERWLNFVGESYAYTLLNLLSESIAGSLSKENNEFPKFSFSDEILVPLDDNTFPRIPIQLWKPESLPPIQALLELPLNEMLFKFNGQQTDSVLTQMLPPIEESLDQNEKNCEQKQNTMEPEVILLGRDAARGEVHAFFSHTPLKMQFPNVGEKSVSDSPFKKMRLSSE